jgi:catalase
MIRMKQRLVVTAMATLVMSAGASAQSASSSAAPAPSNVEPGQLMQSMEAAFGVHPGQRRNHIKGTCVAGEFVGTPAGAKLSRSALFSGKPVPVVGRFSLGGGDPKIADSAVTVRGMAMEFRLPGGNLQHITMINTPTFPVENPAQFNELLIALEPDPKTGAPDPAKLKQFLAAHPTAVSQGKYLAEHSPPRNYFSTTYFSVHTFKFVDAKGAEHPVKWRFVPRGGESVLSAAEIKAAPRDFLESNLIARTKKSPIEWDMVVYVGQPGDPETNPTQAWPESRERIVAGTLSVTQAMPQPGAACEKINFDPLVMAEGIAPTRDPVLLFRSPAYAISFGRRLSGQ